MSLIVLALCIVCCCGVQCDSSGFSFCEISIKPEMKTCSLNYLIQAINLTVSPVLYEVKTYMMLYINYTIYKGIRVSWFYNKKDEKSNIFCVISICIHVADILNLFITVHTSNSMKLDYFLFNIT